MQKLIIKMFFFCFEIILYRVRTMSVSGIGIEPILAISVSNRY